MIGTLGKYEDMTNDALSHKGPFDSIDYTCNGKCSRCGNCCSRKLPLNQRDITRIRKYIRRNKIKPVDHGLKLLSGDSFDMMCPFLKDNGDGTTSCNIYEVRPIICQVYKCNKKSFTKEDEQLFKLKMNAYDVLDLFYKDGKVR